MLPVEKRLPAGEDAAAEARPRLDDRHVGAFFRKLPGCGQAGETGAGYEDGNSAEREHCPIVFQCLFRSRDKISFTVNLSDALVRPKATPTSMFIRSAVWSTTAKIW
jgi:hypothetical protein